MQKQSIYKNLAQYYDLLYSWKDYKKEAVRVRELVAQYKKSPGRDLLEVACGSGKHLQYFKDGFRVLGTDVNEGMLRLARRRVKGAAFRRADMLTLNLGREFDVIACLFSSIGYVKTAANLRKTLRNFARHLKKGGVVVIEPWFAPSAYQPGFAHMATYGDDDLKIARMNVSKQRGNISVMDMHYLVAERGGAVRHFVDRHELGMFTVPQFLLALRAAGLRAKFVKDGLMKDRGIYVGMKP